jgi:hypothetical protein
MEYRYHPIYKYIAFYIILYAFLRHQKVMENNVLLVNSFLITLFVMIVDQMFIANNLTIFQPLSDQYFDSTPFSVVEKELEETPIYDIESEPELEEDTPNKNKTKKSKKSKKSKTNNKINNTVNNKTNNTVNNKTNNKINNTVSNNKIDLTNEDLYYNNEDEMYYNQYYNEPQQQKPQRYIEPDYNERGYDFQEPTLNNDNYFSVEAFNS